MKAFDSIKADDALKQKTLEAAKAGKQVKKTTHVVRWSVLSGIAAALVLTVGVSAAWAGGLFSKNGSATDSPSYAGIGGSPMADAAASRWGGDGRGTTYFYSLDSKDGITLETADGMPVPVPREGVPGAEPMDDPIEVQPNYQAGTLTAAKIDDNLHYQEFIKEWNKNQRASDAYGMNALHRVAVTVQNEQGQPLYNAQVAGLSELGEYMEPGFYARTDAQGKAYLYYLWGSNKFLASNLGAKPTAVKVTYNGQSVTVPLENKSEITVTLNADAQKGTKLDLMFVIDTTGSMGDELEYLKVETESLLKTLQTQMNTRVSMNFYRDEGDEYVVRSYDFTDSVSTAIEQLSAEDAAGGGDTPEAVDQALKNAVLDHEWRDDAVKVLFLVLDASAHEEDNVIASLTNTIQNAALQGIRIVPVMSSGADETTETLCRHLALYTGGQFVFLTDHSGVGGAHREPVTTVDYEVKPLIQILNDVITEYTTF